MIQRISIVLLLALALPATSRSQNRAIAAHALLLDDEAGHTLTILPSLMSTNQIYTFPAVTTYTPGSILFADGSSSINQNNSKFFWDNTNFRVGIGNAAPNSALDVTGAINASQNYRIGGTTILATPGQNNIFAGAGTGFGNTTGWNNAFFGGDAGNWNTTGYQNTFVGAVSGPLVTTGTDNSFFGAGAGWASTTGSNNTFIGDASGWTNATGSNNTVLGQGADVGSPALTNATAIGKGAVVSTSNTVQLGNSSVTEIASQGSFHTTGGSFNTTSGTYRIGGTTILATPGLNNIFVGAATGVGNTTGWNNAFFGGNAGNWNTTGYQNTFVGAVCGPLVTVGTDNSFFGAGAGWASTTGSNNTFIGDASGWTNATGSDNTMLGQGADVGSTNLTNATAIGKGAVVSASNTMQLGNASVTSVTSNGNFNSTAGGLQTNSVTRIDNQGNLPNTGTITMTAVSADPPTPAAGQWTLYVYSNGGTHELRVIGPGGTVNTVSTLTP